MSDVYRKIFCFCSQYEYQKYDKAKLDTVCKTISLVLSELAQLVTGLTYCFENEMKHWCNRSPPALTQLGPAFKRVHRLLQQFVQVIMSTNLLLLGQVFFV